VVEQFNLDLGDGTPRVDKFIAADYKRWRRAPSHRDVPPPRARFNGADYVPGRDDPRLHGQLLRVWSFMRDGRWHTLREISDATGDPHASVSTQLRHLRKPRFGSYQVNREHVGRGLYRYQLGPRVRPVNERQVEML